ncbi:hypothetical protein DPMN_055875 [Dreissena polymorpha]|uniref:Tyr recombinase domain-containing protein n=1 Tax=Dreissena polymorpha TaxID=45954 RepID=A0A9D4HR08_DREPO|nr:hypothetical protein DPMN_055875 [Dreissena polymorpha]
MGFMNVIQRQNLSFTYNGSIVSGISVAVNTYKHSQGHCDTIPLSRQACKQLCPIRAVLRYLRIAPQYPGPLFRFANGEAISTTFFRALLHRCVVASNLDPKLFTAHSLRIWGATHAHSNHMSPSQFSNWVDGNHKHTLNIYDHSLSPYRSYIELIQQLSGRYATIPKTES